MDAKKLLKGHKVLLHPPFSEMSQQDRLLRVALMAYAKHTLDSQHIGWEELGDALYNEICNTVGDDEFCKWGDKIKEENNQTDVED